MYDDFKSFVERYRGVVGDEVRMDNIVKVYSTSVAMILTTLSVYSAIWVSVDVAVCVGDERGVGGGVFALPIERYAATARGFDKVK